MYKLKSKQSLWVDFFLKTNQLINYKSSSGSLKIFYNHIKLWDYKIATVFHFFVEMWDKSTIKDHIFYLYAKDGKPVASVPEVPDFIRGE